MGINNNIMTKDKSKILIMVIGLVLIFSSVFYSHSNDTTIQTSIRYIEPQYAADFSDDKVLVGASHNIFVGKVIEQIGKKESGIGPETQFSVEVIDNIKGDLKDVVVVDQEGGYKDGVLYIIGDKNDNVNNNKDNSYILKTGSTYLFATRYNSKENWYTLNSYPTASKILNTNKNNLNNSQLKFLTENDPRVQTLKTAYKNEIPLDADVKNNKALNSYKSVQEKSVRQ